MRSKKYQDLDWSDDPKNNMENRDSVYLSDIEEAGAIDEMAAATKASEEVNEGSMAVIFDFLKEIIIAIIIAIIVMQFIKPTIVQQRSMEPNFYENDYLLVSRQSYKLFQGTPELGDVIIFSTGTKTSSGKDKLLIKRVIGVPGDVVAIKDGKVYLNGEIIDDSYTKDQYTTGDVEETVIPAESLFCMGDNRASSVDSRSPEIGFVSYDSIVGKVVFRVFPFSEFGRITNPYSS